MIEVSYLDTVTSRPQGLVSIDDFLKSVKSGRWKDNDLTATINALREQTDKEHIDRIKKKLPAVTLSGVFEGFRRLTNLSKHTGLIQIDLDKQEALIDISNVRSILHADKYTYACFLSPTGTGLKLIVQIEPDKETHLSSYLALETYYHTEYGLTIDKQCKDIARACFFSYDQDLFINRSAQVFSVSKNNEKTSEKTAENSRKTPEKHAKKVEKITENRHGSGFSNFHRGDDLLNVIEQITQNSIDITGGYEDWLKIGFALAEGCGEAGREHYHSISQYHPRYDRAQTDNQFNECLKGRKQGIGLPTLFYIAKGKGIDISRVKDVVPSQPAPIKRDVDKPDSKFQQVLTYLDNIYDFRFNQVSYDIESKLKDGKVFEKCNEFDIYVDLQLNDIKFSQNNLAALLRSNLIQRYNPFDYYFSNLPEYNPEFEIDHIANLASYINAKDQNRFNSHLKKMLVRSVACAVNDAVFNKHAFILVHSKQNSGKSTFCRWLCPPALGEYYTENFNNDKDSMIALSENFIINLDELASLSKMELNQLKSSFSKDAVKIRRPYERNAVKSSRRANFVGSTNNLEFLTDHTGSVRWLCFEIDKINFDYKKDIDINMVWAQAVYLYRSGYKYQLDEAEIRENETANEQFTQTSIELDLIQAYYTPADKMNGKFVTAAEIMDRLSRHTTLGSKLTVITIGRAMKKAGHEPAQLRQGVTPRKGYYVKEIEPNVAVNVNEMDECSKMPEASGDLPF